MQYQQSYRQFERVARAVVDRSMPMVRKTRLDWFTQAKCALTEANAIGRLAFADPQHLEP
jgi:hypothetical protein